MGYSASNMDDLEQIASRIRNLFIEEKAYMMATIYDQGLMYPKGILRIIFWIVRKRRKNFIIQIAKKSPQILDEWVNQTIHHMINGKDVEDKNSAGGFSQREINILKLILDIVQNR